MKRLGYSRYVAQGGDWGSPVSSATARQAARRIARCPSQPARDAATAVAMALAGGGPAPAGTSAKERAAFNSLDTFYKKYRAYGVMMGTRPQTIGYALDEALRSGLRLGSMTTTTASPRAVWIATMCSTTSRCTG